MGSSAPLLNDNRRFIYFFPKPRCYVKRRSLCSDDNELCLSHASPDWFRRKASYQDLLGHLLDLLGLGLDLVLQFDLAALHDLQPFHLVLQSLPAVLWVQTQRGGVRERRLGPPKTK